MTRSTESREAYELYLRAGERIARIDRWETRTAIAMLKDATRLDSGYADAWARLGVSCCAMNTHFDAKPHWLEEGEDAVEKAFELEADNAEAHFARGRILWTAGRGFQNRLALRSLARAIERRPGSPQFRLWYSLILQHVGLHEEAGEGMREALSSQPEDSFNMIVLAQLAQFRGDYDEARDYGERCHASDPEFVYHHLFVPPFMLYSNDLAAAEQAIQTASGYLQDEPALDSHEALLWAKRGEAARADAAIERSLQQRPSLTHTHHTWHYVAAAHATLGRTSEAVDNLRAASRLGLPNYPVFRDDPTS